MPGHPRIAILAISGNRYPSYASIAEADKRLAIDPSRSNAWVKALDTDTPSADRSVDSKAMFLAAATNRIDMEAFVGSKANKDDGEVPTFNSEGARVLAPGAFDSFEYYSVYFAETGGLFHADTDMERIEKLAELRELLLTRQSKQINEWPRSEAAPRVSIPETIATPGDDEVPYDIREATILLAGSLAVDAAKPDSKFEGLVGDKGSNIRSVRAGDSQVTYFRNSSSYRPQFSLRYIYPDVYEILRPWLTRGYRRDGPTNFVSGADGESYFDQTFFNEVNVDVDVNL